MFCQVSPNHSSSVLDKFQSTKGDQDSLLRTSLSPPGLERKSTDMGPAGLKAPAAILVISRDTCSAMTSKALSCLFGALRKDPPVSWVAKL